MTRNEPRIAIFDDWMPVRHTELDYEGEEDITLNWEKFTEKPSILVSGNEFSIYDQNAHIEIARIDKFKTCPICRSRVNRHSDNHDGYIFLCDNCGYWSGFGHREWDSHQKQQRLRAVFSKYNPISPLDDASSEYLISHLRRFPKDMSKISPKRAEGFIIDLLNDYLDCEVKKLGGVGDGGIDGFILKNDKMNTIIQIKWRQDKDKAEAVSVMRELVGTLAIKNVPNGILISNRTHFSEQTHNEIEELKTNNQQFLNKISLSLYDYHNIIDMMNVSNVHISDMLKIEKILEWHEKICVFDGAARLNFKHYPSIASNHTIIES